MRVLGKYILVEKIPEPEKKVGSLLLSEEQRGDSRHRRGRVLQVGEGVEFKVAPGDEIYFDKSHGSTLTLDEYDNLVHIIRDFDVVIIL